MGLNNWVGYSLDYLRLYIDTTALFLNSTQEGIITAMNRRNSIIIMIIKRFVSMFENFPINIINPPNIMVTPVIPRIIMNDAMMNSMYVIPTDFSILNIFEKLNPSLNCPVSTISTPAIWEMQQLSNVKIVSAVNSMQQSTYFRLNAMSIIIISGRQYNIFSTSSFSPLIMFLGFMVMQGNLSLLFIIPSKQFSIIWYEQLSIIISGNSNIPIQYNII